jgi:high affinity Mn2+ porin
VRATNIRLSLVAGAVLAHAAALATPAEEQLRKDMAALMQRVERLEKDNRALRGRVEGQATAPKGWNAPVEQRVQALEQSRETTERALASERLSENEPEMATRLKAVEFQMQGLQKQARQIEALEGISASASLTGVVQGVNDGGAVDQKGHSRASYRGDLSVALPGGSMGDIDGKIFTHLRFGQGTGVALRPTYTSAVNSTAFETSAGPDDSFAILAQAWYQLDIPLPRGGYRPHSRERIELNVGKMDPFLFFDQNAIADDETVRFLNNAFVHNRRRCLRLRARRAHRLLQPADPLFQLGSVAGRLRDQRGREFLGLAGQAFCDGPARNLAASVRRPAWQLSRLRLA